jgi:hypothetical protein
VRCGGKNTYVDFGAKTKRNTTTTASCKCAAAAGDFLKVLKDNVDVIGDVGCIRSMYPYICTCGCVPCSATVTHEVDCCW